LKKVGKKSLKELTKWEASNLISLLLKRPTEYVFPCGEKISMDKRDVNKVGTMGGVLEACINYCPVKEIGGDIYNCPDFNEWYEKTMDEHDKELEEMESRGNND